MEGRLRILGLAAFLVLSAGCTSGEESPSQSPGSTSTADAQHPADHLMGNGTGEVEMYAVATDLSSTPQTWFRFRPETFEAKVGDMLNVTVKAAVGNQYPHSLVIDELGVDLGPVTAGATDTTTILLTKAGTFAFYCAEGQHRELGMEGSLTVS